MTEAPTETPVAALEERIVEEYWGFDESLKWYLPDNIQYITFKVMNEGDKAKFQRQTNKDIKLSRNTGDASITADVASERWALLETSVTGWYLYKGGSAVNFSPNLFNDWLRHANPKLVEDLEFAIRKANPWLQSDNMTVEEIDKEIGRLRELRIQVEEREAAKAASSGK